MLKVRPKRKCTSHLKEGVFATVQNFNTYLEIIVNIPKSTINRGSYNNANQRIKMKFKRVRTAKEDVLIKVKYNVTSEMQEGIIPPELELPLSNEVIEGKLSCAKDFFWSNSF